MGIVMESLLCGILGSLFVASWFVGSLIVALKEYLLAKASYYRTLETLEMFKK